MSRKSKFFSTISIFLLLTLILIPSVSAFEGWGDDTVVIEEGEVIENDVYIGANTVIVDGVIKGDLYTGAQTVIINGTVEQDLVTGAQSVLINGTVGDDLRAFAAAVQLGENAKIGDDLLFGGASLETQAGSSIGGDIVIGAAQALVAGDAEGNLLIGSAALELNGKIGGNVNAYVDTSEGNEGMPPTSLGPPMNISVPHVSPGINIDENASIGGDLNYTSYDDLSFPAGVVEGKTLRVEPKEYSSEYEYERPAPPTPAEIVGMWVLNLLRTIITLFLVGLLLGWLFPNFILGAGYKLQTQPLPSFGWGIVAYAAFYATLLVVLIGMIIIAIIFGAISLGGLSGMVVLLGIFTIFAIIVGFVILAAYVTKIIISVMGGNLILARVKPEWVNHKIYPLLVGVVLLALIMSIPVAGWLIKLVIVLFGLGAVWILGREQLGKKEEVIVEA